jgi:hypothetical protein
MSAVLDWLTPTALVVSVFAILENHMLHRKTRTRVAKVGDQVLDVAQVLDLLRDLMGSEIANPSVARVVIDGSTATATQSSLIPVDDTLLEELQSTGVHGTRADDLLILTLSRNKSLGAKDLVEGLKSLRDSGRVKWDGTSEGVVTMS